MYNVVINSLYDYFFSVIQPQLKHAIVRYWESITSPVPFRKQDVERDAFCKETNLLKALQVGIDGSQISPLVIELFVVLEHDYF